MWRVSLPHYSEVGHLQALNHTAGSVVQYYAVSQQAHIWWFTGESHQVRLVIQWWNKVGLTILIHHFSSALAWKFVPAALWSDNDLKWHFKHQQFSCYRGDNIYLSYWKLYLVYFNNESHLSLPWFVAHIHPITIG